MHQDDLNEVRHLNVDARNRDVGPSSASDDDTGASPTQGDAGPKSPPEHEMVVPLERARGRFRATQHGNPDDDDPGPAAA